MASSLLWTWGLFAAFEAEPFVGEFSFFEGTNARLGFVMSVGAGAGGTRHQLKPQIETPATYADTGVHFMGTFSAGLRLQLAKRVTFRLEVREVMYGAYVQGCVPRQTHRPDIIIRGNRSPDSTECNPAFETISSDLQHNAALSLGVGWVF